ncbi:MAG: lipocalin family protein [Saprospiraceae bacterium]|nr:lipocalin family protein [Saprospiraceae bacterium]
MKSFIIALPFAASLFGLLGCQSIPDGVTPVSPFDADKYLGKWYEIARFDFRFEKDLNNTTATYTKRDDGKIGVLNRGFNYVKDKWEEAKGKARFRGDSNVAALEVSFFGPFYAGYNVIALEGNYEYALIAGSSLDYMWILSRTTTIPEDIKQQFLEKAQSLGYHTDNLIWVEHE